MTDKSAVVSLAQLKQLAPFMSKDQTRPYLAGIFCDPKGYLVATTGSIMGIMKCAGTIGCTPMLLPADAVKQALKVKPLRGRGLMFDYNGKTLIAVSHELQTKPDMPVNPASFETLAQFTAIAPQSHRIDGPFVPWRRTVPTIDTAPEAATRIVLNSELLRAFASPDDDIKAVNFLTVESGDGRLLVTNTNPDFLGVMMQIRHKEFADRPDVFKRAAEFVA